MVSSRGAEPEAGVGAEDGSKEELGAAAEASEGSFDGATGDMLRGLVDTLVPSPLPIAQRVADRYDVGLALGRGGMGTVFRAFDIVLHRPVVLKFLHRADPETKERLLQEARAQARVEHENVCRVYEIGEHA